MSKIDKNFKVTLRVNYNYDTLEGLEELLKFAEKNLDNNKFHFFFKPIGRYGGENDQNLDVIEVTEESYILEEILKLCSKYDISYASHFHETGCFNNLCYANYANNLVVLREGTLTKSTSYTEADECELNVVGTIKDGIFNINKYKLALWTNPDPKELFQKGCYECIHYPACMGTSCPRTRVVYGQPSICPPKLEGTDELTILQYNTYRDNNKLESVL